MKKLTILAAFVSAITLVPGAQAQVTVKSLDDGRLQVIDFSGRPPFQRQYVDQNDARYEEYAAQVDFQPYVAGTVDARQSGKSLSSRRFRVSQNPGQSSGGEVVEFARFEEVSGGAASQSSRRSGPRGKSLPFQ